MFFFTVKSSVTHTEVKTMRTTEINNGNCGHVCVVARFVSKVINWFHRRYMKFNFLLYYALFIYCFVLCSRWPPAALPRSLRCFSSFVDCNHKSITIIRLHKCFIDTSVCRKFLLINYRNRHIMFGDLATLWSLIYLQFEPPSNWRTHNICVRMSFLYSLFTCFSSIGNGIW